MAPAGSICYVQFLSEGVDWKDTWLLFMPVIGRFAQFQIHETTVRLVFDHTVASYLESSS